MNKATKYPLLRDAIAIIMGIPNDRLNLCLVRRNPVDWHSHKDAHHCGTVGCAIGWLSLHPQFNALGLKPGRDPADLVLKGREVTFQVAAARLFGITEDEGIDLFAPAMSIECDSGLSPLTPHKEMLRLRVRKFFASKGEACAI